MLPGTLRADGLHLQACVADARGNLRGGHVMPGRTVRTTAEIVLMLLPAWVFSRDFDAGTGFSKLVVNRIHPNPIHDSPPAAGGQAAFPD